jgi:hypothetical protein
MNPHDVYCTYCIQCNVYFNCTAGEPAIESFFFNSRDNKLLNGAHGEDGKVVRRHIFNRIGAIRFLGRARSKIFGN